MNSITAIRTALEADIPVLLWGAPGTGKTAAILALADTANACVEVLIGSTIDPADVAGIPVPDASGNVHLAPPAWARRLHAAIESRKPAWLLLDELSCAPPSVQASLLRVVHDRKAGDIDLAGCRVVAASNPADSAADGGILPPAMASRWCHIDWKVDAAAWAQGEASGWGATRTRRHSAAAALVTAYIRRHPNALIGEPPPGSRGGPNPRAWSAVARGLGSCESRTIVEAAIGNTGRLMAEGLLGAPASSEWTTWAEAQDLPDAEDVLAGRIGLPKRADALAVALAALAGAAVADHPEREPRRV